jgi:hypothetical protein
MQTSAGVRLGHGSVANQRSETHYQSDDGVKVQHFGGSVTEIKRIIIY